MRGKVEECEREVLDTVQAVRLVTDRKEKIWEELTVAVVWMAAKVADKSLFVVSEVSSEPPLFKRRISSKKSSCYIIEYVKSGNIVFLKHAITHVFIPFAVSCVKSGHSFTNQRSHIRLCKTKDLWQWIEEPAQSSSVLISVHPLSGMVMSWPTSYRTLELH